MPTLSIEQIAQVAYDAGFRGDALATAVAIAKGESGWDSDATGDVSLQDGKWGPSVGLFQVRTLRAEQGTGAPRDIDQLYDPAFNARAAFEISGGGTNFKPWSVYKNGRYQQFLGEARGVVSDLESRGVFESGGIDVPVGGGVPAAGSPQPSGDDSPLRTFLEAAIAQRGDTYVFGATASADDADPDQFDCSELVDWAAAQAGIDDVPTASYLQYLDLKGKGATMSVEEALRTPGALLFNFSSEPQPGGGRPSSAHVAISLGDGRTIEARGRKYGVDIFDATDRTWTHAGGIPELAAGVAGATAPSTEPLEYGLDSDDDGLLDEYENYVGTDPFSADTDRDGFLDSEEMLDFDTDPLDYKDNYMVQMTGEVPDYAPPLTKTAAASGDGGGIVDDILSRPRPAPTPSPTPPPSTEPAPPEMTEPAPPEMTEPAPPEMTEPEPGGPADPMPPDEEAGGTETVEPDGEGAWAILHDPWYELEDATRANLASLGFDESCWQSFGEAFAASTTDEWFSTRPDDIRPGSVDDLVSELMNLDPDL